jgi:hypothetical protein
MIKITTPVTDKNGGIHSVRHYRAAMEMLQNHPYKHGRLYHLTLTGSEDKAVYRKVLDALCKKLRTNKMPVMWKACYERDAKKRFHQHIYLLIEANDRHPDSVMHYRKGNFLESLTTDNGLAFTIAQPDNPMHYVAGKQVNSMYVPKTPCARLDDALVWISYLYKMRSKEDVGTQIYTSSTNRGSAKPTIH